MDPKKFAPIWGVIHILAIDAKTKSQQTLSSRTIVMIITHLPCQECSSHAKENIKTRIPFEKYLNEKEDEFALFRWSVDLHNIVNIQTGKPVMGYEAAKTHWEEVLKCTSGCGGHEERKKEEDNFGIIYKK